ncbi:MAG: helix-turn-helix domain-containing protein [SAR324 cluster bacterium]|nr:helix-turn-helix domain-containing protein [SAR324 cluster bacterium]
MIFRRAKHKSNFTTFPNEILQSTDGTKPREDSLSPAALGVLCYLLSFPEDWIVKGSVIANHFQITKNAVTKITDELQDAGYIRRDYFTCEETGKQRPTWHVYDVREKWDPRIGDPRIGDLTNNKREQIISKKQKFLSEPPAGIAETYWRKWWEYKIGSRGRVPDQKTVTARTNEFRRFISFGLSERDIEKIVDHHISMGWKGLGDETWKLTAKLIDEKKMMRGVT